MKNEVFTLDGIHWQAIVNGKVIAADWLSRGAAMAGMQVELRRQNKKK